MRLNIRLGLALGILGVFLLPLHANEVPGDGAVDNSSEILAIQGDAVLTQGEIDAAFSKVPVKYRLAFIRNGERVNREIGDLLRVKIVAADAIATGFDDDPLIKTRMALAAENELARAWMEKIKENTPEADYDALAHEFYLANPDAFMTDEVVDVSHILVNNEARSSEEALLLATSLREQLSEDPSRFDEMVLEYSDDPSKGANGGRFPTTKRGQMVKPFETQAFSLENAGDISEPVETGYGYHIIRLNEKFPAELIPFEEAEEKAVSQVREQHLEAYRSRYLRKLLSDPIELPDGAVEMMVKRYFGENLELAPDFEQ